MSADPSTRSPLEGAFRDGNVVQPSMRVLRRSSLQISEIWSDHRDLVVRGTVPRDDAYVVTLHLRDRPRGAMAAESRWLETRNFQAGNCGIVDHVARAFVVHMASAYGEMRPRGRPPRGGLVPWQQRRARELIDARLDGTLSVVELAAACELSVRHFARAFRQSTGQSPHRWLTHRRLEKAKGMLEGWGQSLTDIARACGFASQSHFTRVFTGAVGTSPGAWRRERHA
jgi:AraC-like DNA-binding protein